MEKGVHDEGMKLRFHRCFRPSRKRFTERGRKSFNHISVTAGFSVASADKLAGGFGARRDFDLFNGCFLEETYGADGVGYDGIGVGIEVRLAGFELEAAGEKERAEEECFFHQLENV